MSSFDRNVALQLAQAIDAAAESETRQSFQALQMYLQRHDRGFANLITDQGAAVIEVIDCRIVDKAKELEKDNQGLRSQVDKLKKGKESECKSYEGRIQALEERIQKQESDYSHLNIEFNHLNSKYLSNKSELEGHRRKVKSLSHANVKRAGWFANGMLATLFLGAVISRVGWPDIYDEVRTRSVKPVAYILGDNAKAFSRWVPSAVWYYHYALVNAEFANIRLMETTASPILAKLSKESCVMVREASKIDPSWLKIEQRIDGKLVQGYMQEDALVIEEGYIGRPCNGLSFVR